MWQEAGWAWLRRLALLDAAVVAMAVGIFEAQAHLWTIFLQVEKLLAVEGSATLPGREKEKQQQQKIDIQQLNKLEMNRSCTLCPAEGTRGLSVRVRIRNEPSSSFLSESHVQPACGLTVG